MLCVLLALACGPNVFAASLRDHFLGVDPVCRTHHEPLIVVTDTTRRGEIDDTISLAMYRRLETMGCVDVIAVVPIFGNGGASTRDVAANLAARLERLDIGDWPILPGPRHAVPFEREHRLGAIDRERLAAIAARARRHDTVVIAELGPFTVSARLLMTEMLAPRRVKRILGVGGRSPGERFAPTNVVPFAFRDMNVAEDRMAIHWLLGHAGGKLWLVTYRTGIGARMIEPSMLDPLGTVIREHGRKRARTLRLIGYRGMMPLWDTWTAAYFVKGGADRLGCRPTPARMRYARGYKPTDGMQLHLLGEPGRYSHRVTACHARAR